jgi:glycolate dehydrogenase FAD-binding subunit
LPSVSSLDEAAEYLAAARADGRHVRIGEDLTTDGLARILEHEPGDLTCTVEAGIRLSVLQQQLARQGQRLSLDPPGDPTIGACLAANLSGPLRHRFGAPRDLVLGVTLVLADGTIASAGGKVVKNVAGYDLGKLVCGSEGTLALIGRVSLRLHPLPAVTKTLVVETDDTPGVAASLLRSQLQPTSLDVLHPGRVAVLFEGGQAAVGRQLDRAAALVGGAESSADVWDEARAAQAAARGRLTFPPGALAATLDRLDTAVARPAVGVAYVSDQAVDDRSEGVRRLAEAVRAAFDPDGVLAAA